MGGASQPERFNQNTSEASTDEAGWDPQPF